MPTKRSSAFLRPAVRPICAAHDFTWLVARGGVPRFQFRLGVEDLSARAAFDSRDDIRRGGSSCGLLKFRSRTLTVFPIWYARKEAES